MTLIHLFFIFFYIGLFAIGGGLVAATFMQQTLVEQYHLISAEKFYNMLAISESTPGPIGINIATYIGTELFGPFGGIVATLGEVLPSLIVIVLIARVAVKFQEKPVVKTVLSVMRPATSGLVLVALVQIFFIALFYTNPFTDFSFAHFKASLNWSAIALYEVCLVILFRTKLHPVVIVAAGAVFGIIFF